MKWIILIGDETLNLNVVKTIEHYGSMSNYDVDESRHCVEYATDHIFYDYEGDVLADYEEAELNKIPFTRPHFIMMVYTSEERMKKVVSQDNFLRGVYVDNGFGLIIPIEEFIKSGMPMDCEYKE